MGKVITAREIIRLLNYFGGYAEKKNPGQSSRHRKIVRIDGMGKPVIIPRHPGDAIAPGTVNQIVEAISLNEGIPIERVWRLLLDL